MGGCELDKLDSTIEIWPNTRWWSFRYRGFLTGSWLLGFPEERLACRDPLTLENLTNLCKLESQQGQPRFFHPTCYLYHDQAPVYPFAVSSLMGMRKVSHTLLLVLDRVDFVTTKLPYSWDWCSCLWMDAWLKKKKVFSPLQNPKRRQKYHTRSPGSALHYNKASHMGLGRQCITKP